MNYHTILQVSAGHTVPKDFFANLLKKQPANTFGFAVQDRDDKGNPDLAIVRKNISDMSHEQIMEEVDLLNNNAKEFDYMMVFGKLDAPINPESIQPFVMTDPDNNSFLAIGLDGDFPKFAQPSSGLSDEVNYVNNLIFPKIVELCELTDGDLSKMLPKLGDGSSFEAEFLNNLSERGVISIMPMSGKPILFGKNKLGSTFDWGSTTQMHDYGAKPVEVIKTEEAPKKKWGFGGKSAITSATSDTPAPSTEPSATPPAKETLAPVVDKPKTSVPDAGSKDVSGGSHITLIATKPPAWLNSNKDVQAWYRHMNNGALPDNWKKKIALMLPADAPVYNNRNEMQAAILKGKTGPIANTSAVQQPKTETAVLPPKVEAPKSGKDIAAQREEIGPIMSAAATTKALDFVAKHLDGNSAAIVNPIEMQEIEKKFKTFSESVGLVDPKEMLSWPTSAIFAFMKECPEAGAMMVIELRRLWATAANFKLEDLIKPIVKVEEKTVATTAAPAEAPKKKWGFGKKAA